MKYIYAREIKGDIFTEEFATAEETISHGDNEWDGLTQHDRDRTTAAYILESVNPDEDAPDHLDGNIIKTWKR